MKKETLKRIFFLDPLPFRRRKNWSRTNYITMPKIKK
jgi:hypothetical protein